MITTTTIRLETALCYQHYFCNTELRTAIITAIKGLLIQTQQNTFVLFTLFKLTLDERKTLTKILMHKTSHNHSPNQRKLWNKKTGKSILHKKKKELFADEDISILEEDNPQIYAHLDNVLVHMIDKQEAAVFKSKQDFNRNKEKISEYIKYAENWQVISVICSYTAKACDILLIVAMIVFLLKYHKTMQAMLAAFLQTNTKNSGIQSVQADQTGRTYPPLFTLNLPKEEEIIDDLKEIVAMEYVVQVIMIIVCIAVVIIIMYFYYTKCGHTHTILKYCFPFLPISRIICMSCCIDLFVEVTNITKGNSIWAHFTVTGCFPSQICIYQD